MFVVIHKELKLYIYIFVFSKKNHISDGQAHKILYKNVTNQHTDKAILGVGRVSQNQVFPI